MSSDSFQLSGQIVDVVKGSIFPGEISVENGRIASIKPTSKAKNRFILPGLVDAHVHIESSLLTPSQFARLAVVHGTVATVSDPHVIANVLGIRGIEYMLENAIQVPFWFYFGAPSCVPATAFETSGAHLSAEDVENLLAREDIYYLSEMMNYPGVLNKDPEVMAKLEAAKKQGKAIDGHAPGLLGKDAELYAASGITTDHECTTLEEAMDKIRCGMKIIIREGSAAKNFNALISLIANYPESVMFCSDDKHPDALVYGHIDELVRRAMIYDYKPMDVIRAATLNPVRHYGLKHGLLQEGDSADFIIVNSLEDFEVEETYIRGKLVAKHGKSLIESVEAPAINNFNRPYIGADDLLLPAGSSKIRVIEAIDGQLLTNELIADALTENGNAVSNTDEDILKLVVLNRYQAAPPAIAFVTNFGLTNGAIASTVAHDSHNIIAVGVDDNSLARAINLVIDNEGGLSLVSDDGFNILPLPVAGLMSNKDGYEVAELYETLDAEAKSTLGSTLSSPYMTLSFLALLVIPQLKLSDKGLFDGKTFRFTNVFAD